MLPLRKLPFIVLPKSEVELIQKLQSWLDEKRVVAFLARLARVRRVEDGIYSVPSASTPETHRVNLNLRVCPCQSFYHRRRCIHYKLAAVKQLLDCER